MDPKPENKTTEDTVRHEESWRARVAADLLSHQAEQEQLWGGIDELTALRYQEGLSTGEERARVERAMRDHPALRESMERTRKNLEEWGMTSGRETAPVDDAQQNRQEEKTWADRTDHPESGLDKKR